MCSCWISYENCYFVEKYLVINYSHDDILLKKRSELISKCRHENNDDMLASTGNSAKINNDSVNYYSVLFIDILWFLFFLLGNKKIM